MTWINQQPKWFRTGEIWAKEWKENKLKSFLFMDLDISSCFSRHWWEYSITTENCQADIAQKDVIVLLVSTGSFVQGQEFTTKGLTTVKSCLWNKPSFCMACWEINVERLRLAKVETGKSWWKSTAFQRTKNVDKLKCPSCKVVAKSWLWKKQTFLKTIAHNSPSSCYSRPSLCHIFNKIIFCIATLTTSFTSRTKRESKFKNGCKKSTPTSQLCSIQIFSP